MMIFYEKQCLPVIIYNKKHSSKQVVAITYTLGKWVFVATTFKRLYEVRKHVVGLFFYYFCVGRKI